MSFNEPFFIHHGGKCLARLDSSNRVGFIDCDKGNTSYDKLWRYDPDDKLMHVATKKCLDVTHCRGVYPGADDHFYLRDCRDVDDEPIMLAHGSVCCGKKEKNRHCFATAGFPNAITPYGSINDALQVEVTSEPDMVRGCCTDTIRGSQCGIYKIGHLPCDEMLVKACTGISIREDGTPEPLIVSNSACRTWCKNSPVACKTAKLDFCAKAPLSPYCDCINAAQRPSLKALIAKAPAPAQELLPTCFLQSRCRDEGVLVPGPEVWSGCPKEGDKGAGWLDLTKTIKCTATVCYNPVPVETTGAASEEPVETTGAASEEPVETTGDAEEVEAASPASWPLWIWLLLLVVVAAIAYVALGAPAPAVQVASTN